MKYSFLIFLIGFISCTKKIDIKIPRQDDHLVIEGHVTNHLYYFYVRLSSTLPTNGGNDFPPVMNALVTISDNVGNTDTLFVNVFWEYNTKNKKREVIGRVYSLNA